MTALPTRRRATCRRARKSFSTVSLKTVIPAQAGIQVLSAPLPPNVVVCIENWIPAYAGSQGRQWRP
ncbi:hypothetical protein MASSI9I_90295 [Massilia sp. 9I]|nr:hypothetical protein MASSI9I_90295 [Massilia sp. 9I]